MVWSDAERAAYRERIHNYELSDAWHARSRRFRDARLSTSNYCLACKKPGIEVVHHVTYDRAFTGREPDKDLRGLCHSCHNYLHSLTPSHGGTMSLWNATTWVLDHTPRYDAWTTPAPTYYPPIPRYHQPQPVQRQRPVYTAPPSPPGRPERKRTRSLVPAMCFLIALAFALWYIVGFWVTR